MGFFFLYFVLFNSWVVCLSMGSLTVMDYPYGISLFFLHFESCHSIVLYIEHSNLEVQGVMGTRISESHGSLSSL